MVSLKSNQIVFVMICFLSFVQLCTVYIQSEQMETARQFLCCMTNYNCLFYFWQRAQL